MKKKKEKQSKLSFSLFFFPTRATDQKAAIYFSFPRSTFSLRKHSLYIFFLYLSLLNIVIATRERERKHLKSINKREEDAYRIFATKALMKTNKFFLIESFIEFSRRIKLYALIAKLPRSRLTLELFIQLTVIYSFVEY